MIFLNRIFPLLCGVLLISCAAPSTDPLEVDPIEITENSTEIITPSQPNLGQLLPITATAKVESSGKIFELEVTQNDEQRSIGLMYREELADNRGMLFEFDPAGPVSFWMKNCRMNLDMLFLQNGVVQAIARNAPPCESDPCPTYGTPADIDQVIEIRGGLADEIGLTEGDAMTVTFIES